MNKLLLVFLIFPIILMAEAAPHDSKLKISIRNWDGSAKLTLRGIGPVRVGMSYHKVKKALNGHLSLLTGTDGECFVAKPTGVSNDLIFMFNGRGRLSRIDIGSPNYKTLSGAHIEQSKADLINLYQANLERSAHKYYRNGYYFTYVPTDSSDRNLRMIFEVNDDKVVDIRTGELPDVAYVSGCDTASPLASNGGGGTPPFLLIPGDKHQATIDGDWTKAKVSDQLDLMFSKWQLADISDDDKKYCFPEGVPANRHVSELVGEFNGDGISDYAYRVFDITNSYQYLLAFVSPSSYFIITKNKKNDSIGAPLILNSKGDEYHDWNVDEDVNKIFKNDAITEVFCERASLSYELVNDQFMYYHSGD